MYSRGRLRKTSRYDEEAGDRLAGERRRRFEIDRSVRIVLARFGLQDPRQIDEVIDLGLRTMRAVIDGAPTPPPNPGSAYQRRSLAPRRPASEAGQQETLESEQDPEEDEPS
jgi:hypothetical protein